jgi:hypothetical protein
MFGWPPEIRIVLLVPFGTTIATAQIVAPPRAQQLELTQITQQAGYECLAALLQEVATRSNGKNFLVVKSGRGGANARPIM